MDTRTGSYAAYLSGCFAISSAVLSFLLLAVHLAVAHVIYGATLGWLAGRARAE